VEVVDALKKRDMWDNLLFVTSSDNGGPVRYGTGANNYPLKGGKVSDWQGGVRVNAFVSGGYLPEKMRGQKTDGYIHLADWYGTFCAIAGVDPTDDKAAKAKLPPVDSINMWPLISGQTTTSPRTDVPISNVTLISGDYKILTGTVPEAGWTGPHYPNITTPAGLNASENCGDSGCLYNIKKDPGERNNIADTMPAVLKDMQQKLKMYQDTYFDPDRGKVAPEACQMAMGTYGGFWGPFLGFP
jgi:arylsulfatase I/J